MLVTDLSGQKQCTSGLLKQIRSWMGKLPGLPNPNKCLADVEAMAFQSANAAITNAILVIV